MQYKVEVVHYSILQQMMVYKNQYFIMQNLYKLSDVANALSQTTIFHAERLKLYVLVFFPTLLEHTAV